jgi:hypothetical protein
MKKPSINITIACVNCNKTIRSNEELTEEDWNILSGAKANNFYCDDCKDLTKKEVLEETDEFRDKLTELKKILPMLAENEEFKENLLKAMSENFLKFKPKND